MLVKIERKERVAKKIIITDSVDKKAVQVLEKNGFAVTYQPGMKKEDILKVIHEYSGLVVRSDTKVTADIIEKMQNMEVIGRAGAGVDNIDAEAATRKGIIVMNTPGGNTLSTAEHAFTLMLSMCRYIAQADASVKAGKWDRKSFKGTEVHGKTLGVFGLGRIGREVALRAKAFGMNVVGYDPVLSNDAALAFGITLMSIESVFEYSDIITLHVPLDDKTRNLVRKETMALCKKGVKIINCSRGGIVHEDDLVEALNSGQVSAAALDVYLKEPPDFSHPLFSHPKVITTPHLGASTDEAQEKVAIQIAEQMVEYFTISEIKGAVNAASIASFSNKKLAPYVKLAEKLGALGAQLGREKIQEVKVSLQGELMHESNGLLETATVKGFLTALTQDQVNLVNAPFLAKEFGLKSSEEKSLPSPEYANKVSVEFISAAGKQTLAGTVFGNNEIRIVQVDEFTLEMLPEGPMIFYTNIDKPGMVASVSKLLAEEGINIAGLSLGRLGLGKEALTVISLDSEVPAETLQKIAGISGVKNVVQVKV